MGWLRSVGAFKSQVSIEEYSLFNRALLQMSASNVCFDVRPMQVRLGVCESVCSMFRNVLCFGMFYVLCFGITRNVETFRNIEHAVFVCNIEDSVLNAPCDTT